MKKTFEFLAGIIIIIFMGVVLWQITQTSSVERIPKQDETPIKEQKSLSDEFRFELEELVRIEIGQPIEGYEPEALMKIFPGLRLADFDGVSAEEGFYIFLHGYLIHELETGEAGSADKSGITEAGFSRLMENVIDSITYSTALESVTTDQIFKYLVTNDSDIVKLPSDKYPTVCTADAKICPDGSAVGRTGPNCEFAECPPPSSEESKRIVCSPESKLAQACTMEYAPVCGLVQIQCVTTPCDPVEETFSNGCTACARGNVDSYTDGACEVDL